MAEDIAKLGLEIDSKDILKATKRLDKLEKQSNQNVKATGKLKKSFGGLGTALGSLGLGLTMGKIISLTAEQERVTRQLDQAIRSTGGGAGFTTDELRKMAAGMQKVTNFGDEAILGMQSILLTFTNLKGDVLPATTMAVLDLSERMGTDLQSSALQLAKALNDPVANLGALSRAGIQFSKDQKKVIKSLWESGEQAKAQKIILKELEVQFGGSATAARDSFGGALKSLGNAFNDLLEGDGSLNEAKSAIEELTDVLQRPETKEAFSIMVQGVVELTSALAKGIVNLTKFGDAIGKVVADFVHGKPESVELLDSIVAINYQLSKVSQNSSEAGRLMKQLGQLTQEYSEKFGGTITPTSVEQPSAPSAVGDMKQTQFGGAVFGEGEKDFEQGESLEEFANRLNEEREAQREHREELLQIESDYYDRLYNLQSGSQEAAVDFANAMREGDYKSAVKNGSLMLANAAQHSKKAFELQKAFALANAVATLPSAVIKSFHNGGGYPWGIVPASLMAAAGAAQIQQIKSTQFGGGGGGVKRPSGGGGTALGAPAASGLPAGSTAVPSGKEKPVQTVNVTLEGHGYSAEDIRNLMDGISEQLGDGVDLKAT